MIIFFALSALLTDKIHSSNPITESHPLSHRIQSRAKSPSLNQPIQAQIINTLLLRHPVSPQCIFSLTATSNKSNMFNKRVPGGHWIDSTDNNIKGKEALHSKGKWDFILLMLLVH